MGVCPAAMRWFEPRRMMGRIFDKLKMQENLCKRHQQRVSHISKFQKFLTDKRGVMEAEDAGSRAEEKEKEVKNGTGEEEESNRADGSDSEVKKEKKKKSSKHRKKDSRRSRSRSRSHGKRSRRDDDDR